MADVTTHRAAVGTGATTPRAFRRRLAKEGIDARLVEVLARLDGIDKKGGRLERIDGAIHDLVMILVQSGVAYADKEGNIRARKVMLDDGKGGRRTEGGVLLP